MLLLPIEKLIFYVKENGHVCMMRFFEPVRLLLLDVFVVFLRCNQLLTSNSLFPEPKCIRASLCVGNTRFKF